MALHPMGLHQNRFLISPSQIGIYLGLPQAVISARINSDSSDWLFRPKLKNPPEAKNYAEAILAKFICMIFLRWNPSKNSGTGSFARFTPNYAWITPSFAWVFFLKKKKMQNAVPFSCRLKVSPELGISPAGCFSSMNCQKSYFRVQTEKTVWRKTQV